MSHNRLAALTLAPMLALVVAACSSGASSTPVAPPQSSSASAPSVALTRMEIKLTDALKIEPAMLMVPVGKPVTFVVTNTGANNHEFYVGDEAAQTQHEGEMTSMGGMAHDEANGIGLKPGETKELTMTFDKVGATIAGCHEPAHYGAGMKAAVTIGG